jgi:hypothetical protein
MKHQVLEPLDWLEVMRMRFWPIDLSFGLKWATRVKSSRRPNYRQETTWIASLMWLKCVGIGLKEVWSKDKKSYGKSTLN